MRIDPLYMRNYKCPICKDRGYHESDNQSCMCDCKKELKKEYEKLGLEEPKTELIEP